MTDPNWQVYHHILDLFQLWAEDAYRKNEYYERLCSLAKTLELSDDSPVQNILTCVKTPTEKQAKLVAREMAVRAVEVHFELG